MKPALCRVATFVLFATACSAPEKMGWKSKDAWMQEHEAEIAQLIQHIHDMGPVR